MSRLKSLYVKDFRSIDGEVNISIDAPIVLIHGPNGAGKTSLLAAIELALTGAVPSLSRADPDYLNYLPHKDRPFGEVRLEVAADDGSVRTAEIRVTTTGVTGTPILSGLEASFFSERSYLAQSTLGRLLEIYQHSDKKSDSPLTRFVKELLGLDRMEALIGGLHSAGNVARLKAPVPSYQAARDDIPVREKAIEELRQQQAEADALVATLDRRLREGLAVVDAGLIDRITDLAELATLLASDPDETQLVDLVRARREADVSQASLAATITSPATVERSAIAAASSAARTALDDWTAVHGDRIEALLVRAATLFADISVSSESGYVERARLLGTRIDADVTRVAEVLASHEAALNRRDDLTRQVDEARVRLARLDEEIAAAADANESVARSLSDLSSHIHDDICPVCDRDFTEVSATPLAAHITAKVAAMVEQAGRLQSLSQARTQTNGDIARLDREIRAAGADVIGDVELNPLKARTADLKEVAGQLTEAMPQFQEGDRLRGEATQGAQSLLAFQNADQSAVVLEENLNDLARRVGVTVGTETATEALLATVRATIDAREAAVTARQASRRTASETVAALVKAQNDRRSLQAKTKDAEAELATITARKTEADAIIEVAKDLVRQTREARGRVVRHVFNDELNAVWRDLFVRLAPEEPFIPAFAIPDAAGADIEAVLETHHRRGGKGGNPRAMLSAGNLNTAALTLFLALHLSVKAKLPWLVIDDPVQSMDEVHIAQFAALLRTLAKRMHRQVIIAVHERSLFDYLSLELSPAFDGDRLNVIELGRNAVGITTSRWDPKHYVTDKAIAA
jgi:exonuclease SbcC